MHGPRLGFGPALVSARAERALRLLVLLAGAADAGSGLWLDAHELARSEGVTAKDLERTLGSLRAAGIIASRRGRSGGYQLVQGAAEVSVDDVLAALDHAPRPGSSARRRSSIRVPPEFRPRPTGAREPHGDRVHAVWRAAGEVVTGLLATVSLADLRRGRPIRPPALRGGQGRLFVSARFDYALRALVVLAATDDPDAQVLVKGEAIAVAQGLPVVFLESILRQCRLAGLVASRRGVDGGYRLAGPSSAMTVAGIIRALDPALPTGLAAVGPAPSPTWGVGGAGSWPADGPGRGTPLPVLWAAAGSALRMALDGITLADIVRGRA